MESDSDLVSSDLEESIRSACRTTVGDSLRSITYFTESGFEQMYLRSDLEPDADLAEFVQQEAQGFDANRGYRGSELGDYRFTIRAFENGYMTRVTRGTHGVFVTTDGLTMRRSEEVASALDDVLSDRVSEPVGSK